MQQAIIKEYKECVLVIAKKKIKFTAYEGKYHDRNVVFKDLP